MSLEARFARSGRVPGILVSSPEWGVGEQMGKDAKREGVGKRVSALLQCSMFRVWMSRQLMFSVMVASGKGV